MPAGSPGDLPPAREGPPLFGALPQRYRLAAGLSQEELAERAGLSRRGISDLERGRHAPYPTTARHLVEALGLREPGRSALLAAGRGVRTTADGESDRVGSPDGQRPAHNLPRQLTSFIGRDDELAELRRLVAIGPLLTLTGPGGVGKTRLALRLAEAVLPAYADGAWLVEFAALTDPRLVPEAVAATLGVREQPGTALVQTLAERLGPKHLLLVLDNCEHLIDACAELANRLLAACHELRIVGTSREPLGIPGEVGWRVPSLTVPDAAKPAGTAQLSAYAATRLFLERAQAARPGFRVTDRNVQAIVEVCRRLDGIPLALELAATRVRLLSIEDIAARLDDRFRLLTVGGRTAPRRQQTLRATLDWSYALLQEPERRLFSRLSVFAGGWSLSAAESICADDTIDASDILSCLGRLVDQSLVVAQEHVGRVRYRLLETMRQYAAEQLEAAGESMVIRGRHRDWFQAKAESSPFERFDPDHVTWLASELDNLRAALRWSLQSGAVEAGLRLARATGAYWYQCGQYTEGRAWLAEVVARAGGDVSPALASALIWAGHLTNQQGDTAAAGHLIQHGTGMARALGDHGTVALGLLLEAGIMLRAGELGQPRSLLEEGLSLSRAHGLSGLEYYHLSHLATVLVEAGDPVGSGAVAAQSLALARKIGHARGSANALRLLGRAAVGRGNHASGRDLLERSLALYRRYADWDGMQGSLRALGHVALDQADAPAAGRCFRESLALAKAAGDRLELARSLEGLTGVWLAAHPELTVRLAAAATATRAELAARPYPWESERVDGWLEAARRGVGHQVYVTAWTEGLALSLDQAIALDEHALAQRLDQPAHPHGRRALQTRSGIHPPGRAGRMGRGRTPGPGPGSTADL
jgi:predicted ATPase/DNA-binding XRE family transcriptional regulator